MQLPKGRTLNDCLVAVAAIMACAGALTMAFSPAARDAAATAEPIVGLEHVAINVADVDAFVAWFTQNLDMRVARHTGGPSNAHFLADAAGRCMLEVYRDAAAPVPDYPAMHPLALHIAFTVGDVEAARARLIAAGATPEGEISVTEAGDQLAMLRCPQGIPVQLVKRARPMLD
jgi:catechol 2,3-dioxygenase-like lactoylglutathione lyase family enzyme